MLLQFVAMMAKFLTVYADSLFRRTVVVPIKLHTKFKVMPLSSNSPIDLEQDELNPKTLNADQHQICCR